MLQRFSGITLLPINMCIVFSGDDFLESILLQVHVEQGRENIAQRIDDGSMLFFCCQKLGQFRIGILQLLLRFQFSSLGFMNGLGGENHMGQFPVRIPVTFNEGTLSPGGCIFIFLVKEYDTLVLL